MPCYRYFGGILRSEIEVPELEAAPDTLLPTWSFRIAWTAAPDSSSAVRVVDDDIGGGATVSLFRTLYGVRLAHSDTGVFDVTAGGHEITWYPAPDAPVWLARLDLIGRVLATAMQMMGALCLHASAVAVGGRAIGFLAPKGYGKSTLAVALTYAGAQLITDDTLAVFPGPPAISLPGVHSVRLRPDAARRFERTRDRPVPEETGGRVLDSPPTGLRRTEGAPLVGLYLLAPAEPEAQPRVRRDQLAPLQAALSLVVHGKLGPLQGSNEAAINLERATRVTATVPVYTLRIARDLSYIDEVAREVIGWHGSD